MQIEAKLVLIPEYSEEVQLSIYSKSSKTGKPASPAQLFKLTKAALDAGVCIFVFRKTTGELRKAVGTRKYDIMPSTLSDPSKPFNPQKFEDNDIKTAFWDYEANAWKSFQNTSVVAVLVV